MKIMNFHQSIFQNNNLKIIKCLSLIILIIVLSFKANTEIPEKYKIESSLSKCKGTDYTKWSNCYGEYKFPRIEYKGEWKDGNFHGKGVLREAWGGVYKGDFKNNLAEGYGRQEELYGSWWEGEFKNDEIIGKATYYDSEEKCLTEGIMLSFMLNGQGKVKCEDGHYAEGTFKKGVLNSQGLLILSNGNKYSGEFKDGNLNGKG
ncbi:MAG: hypothetical protein QF864_06115, partial [SAR202 cluster bacterium]|nr:hypothetical protein [SAR202 cluster bacterium]